MRRFGLTMLAAVAMNVAVAQAESIAPERFAWQLPITVSGQEAIYRFEVPQAVYQGATRRDLGDLRIFNAVGEVVPHALLQYAPTPQASLQTTPLNFFPWYRENASANGGLTIAVDQRADGSLVSTRMATSAATAPGAARLAGYVIDASAIKQPLVALIVDWDEQPKGTALPVGIEASDNLQDWRGVAGEAQLVDLSSGGQRLRRNRLELDGVSARYWRLSWPSDYAAIRLTSLAAETSTLPARPSPLRWGTATTVRPGKNAGEFVFEAEGLPIEALRLALPQSNTVAPVRVLHRDSEREPWHETANTVAYRLQRGGAEVLSPPIMVCCSSHRFWQIAFDLRGGGIGQGMPKVELGWVPQQGLFVARGGGPFRLAYGSRVVEPAGFSAATLVPGYRQEDFPTLPEARLGTAVPLAPLAAATPAVAVAAANWRSIGLWSVLVLGVLVLGGMTWRLLRELNAKPDQG